MAVPILDEQIVSAAAPILDKQIVGAAAPILDKQIVGAQASSLVMSWRAVDSRRSSEKAGPSRVTPTGRPSGVVPASYLDEAFVYSECGPFLLLEAALEKTSGHATAGEGHLIFARPEGVSRRRRRRR